MQWHSVQLSSSELAQGRNELIQARFDRLYQALGTPPAVAMLSSHLPNALRLYFSPATAQYAEAFMRLIDARPCEPPPADASLVVGGADALDSMQPLATHVATC